MLYSTAPAGNDQYVFLYRTVLSTAVLVDEIDDTYARLPECHPTTSTYRVTTHIQAYVHRAKNICVIARDLVLGESTVYGGARMYVGVRGCVRVQYCTVLKCTVL